MKGNGKGNGQTWEDRRTEIAKADEKRKRMVAAEVHYYRRAEKWTRLATKLLKRAAKGQRWVEQSFRSRDQYPTAHSTQYGDTAGAPRFASVQEVSAWSYHVEWRRREAKIAQSHALDQLNRARHFRQLAAKAAHHCLHLAERVMMLLGENPGISDSKIAELGQEQRGADA